MKIYFAGSIRGGKEKKKDYKRIIYELSKFGEVLTEHIGGKRASVSNKVNDLLARFTGNKYIFERDMIWLKMADVVIADLSVNSFGVGFEIGKADELGKKIILIWDTKFIKDNNIKISALAKGNSKIIKFIPYDSIENLFKKLWKLLLKIDNPMVEVDLWSEY
ncbi:hypothetical protein LCGC14_0174440 [marine sediment metagenome]|uniref:5-hydroxymethyl-dUMP N-hydrolase n=1 Tax=marine sediment metagenome TaxID=412755 RepID=A0A0F9UR04_9ZZZZ